MPWTELHEAAQNECMAEMERLIAARADVEAKDEVSIARRRPRRGPTPRPVPPPFSVAGGLGTARAPFFREGR